VKIQNAQWPGAIGTIVANVATSNDQNCTGDGRHATIPYHRFPFVGLSDEISSRQFCERIVVRLFLTLPLIVNGTKTTGDLPTNGDITSQSPGRQRQRAEYQYVTRAWVKAGVTSTPCCSRREEDALVASNANYSVRLWIAGYVTPAKAITANTLASPRAFTHGHDKGSATYKHISNGVAITGARFFGAAGKPIMRSPQHG